MYVYLSVLCASLCLCVYKLWGKVDDVRIHTHLHWLAFLIFSFSFYVLFSRTITKCTYLSACWLHSWKERWKDFLLRVIVMSSLATHTNLLARRRS